MKIKANQHITNQIKEKHTSINRTSWHCMKQNLTIKLCSTQHLIIKEGGKGEKSTSGRSIPLRCSSTRLLSRNKKKINGVLKKGRGGKSKNTSVNGSVSPTTKSFTVSVEREIMMSNEPPGHRPFQRLRSCRLFCSKQV